jgi:hypothetical protein
MVLQEVRVAVSEVWRDSTGQVAEASQELAFVVLGTGIGRTYNVEGQSLVPNSDVVLFLTRRPIGWREGGAKTLLTLSGGYQGVYSVLQGDRVRCAEKTDPSLARSTSMSELRRLVEQIPGPTAVPRP